MSSLVSSSSIKIPNGNLLIDACLAMPKEVGTYPAIVVVQEIFGVNAHIRDVTERIASLGYVAIAPAIYQRIAPGFETGYAPEDVKIGREYKVRTKASELLSDIQATIDYLETLPSVKAGGVGSIGFCFGGHVAYLAATLPRVKATASFYGAGLTDWCPGEERESTLVYTPEIEGEIYCFFGKEDASIPVEQLDLIESELQRHQIKHQVFRYENAGHGFFCDRLGSYNKQAADAAWLIVQDLFSKTLSA